MCQDHFRRNDRNDCDPRSRKPATDVTAAKNAAVARRYPIANQRDFEEASKGLVAVMKDPLFKTAAGAIAFDAGSYEFIAGDAPASVNPSLWRMEKLNNNVGLFKVCEGIWQIRGYDAANMTLIAGESGWIVIDPLTCAEVARSVLAFAMQHLGVRPVTSVIYTHAHVDHFGGVRGVIEEADVVAGKVSVIAPEKFMEYAISENVLAGVAMSRRAQYQFGVGLETGERAGVGCGLGKGVAAGSVGLIPPTDTIRETLEERVVDGVRIVFQMAQGSESPSEMTFYFPDHKAVCLSEVVCATMHNIYTPRGAQARDALRWSKYINECMDLFPEADVAFRSHHWPLWGQDRIRENLRNQRDVYRFLHDQTLFLANSGKKMGDLANAEFFPKGLESDFSCHGYYGTLSHNLRGVYNFYLGFYDGNPASLHPLTPVESAKRYVKAIGGQAAVVARAREAFVEGDYRWAADLNNHAVFADPADESAKFLQADILEQLGYQAESAIWRNEYLMAARELRHGVLPATLDASSADMLRAMGLEMIFDLLSVRLDHEKVDGLSLGVNLEFTDTGERYALELSNSVLNNTKGRVLSNPDVSLRMTMRSLFRLLTNAATLQDLVESGEAEQEGDPAVLLALFASIVDFRKDFPIVTP
ncbi:alkyl/aryl-sulfatase [Paraburkholderia sediminicola]|uniref:alkyl/aryl-sulfatase n=1 Tax=Paraburkholderia sediminicola TaxID=458836 RepID=UPI0038B70DB1